MKRGRVVFLMVLAGCAGAFPAGFALAADATAGDASVAASGRGSDDSALEEVVITGYAASLERAIATKRQADVVSDGISAEDIGKFPETNLAESLQHVTGVEITRNQGEGQFISVRGLDPKFTNVLYNGRQIPAGTGTRTFDFRTIAADFGNQVNVYKSPTADMLESGLAATVDVQTLKPLAYGKQKWAANLEGNYDDQAKGGLKPHLSSLYTNTFLDNRLGLAVGIDLSERIVDDQQATSTGNLTQSYPVNGVPTPMNVIYGIGLAYNEGTNKRQSVMAALQYKVSDSIELRLDTLVSSFQQKFNSYAGDSFWPGANAGASPVSSVTLDGNNSATAWAGSNVFGYVSGNYNDITQDLNSTAVGARFTSGVWTTDAEVSYGYSKEATTTMYLNTGTLPGAGASLFYDTHGDPGNPLSFGFTNGFNALDKNNFQYMGLYGYYKEPTSDAIKNARVDLTGKVSWGWVNSVQFGVNYEDQVLKNSPNWLSVPNAFVGAAIGTNSSGLPNIGNYLVTKNNTAFGSFPPTFLTVDLKSLFNAVSLAKAAAATPPVTTLSSTTTVEERSQAAYAELRFANATSTVRGNFGVRVVRTEEVSAGYGPTASSHLEYGITFGNWTNPGFASVSNSYVNVLPTFNVAYNLRDNLVARLALARVMQRPDMNLLAAASSPSMITQPPVSGPWYGNLAQGNPNLKPYLSNQFDLSLEWYIDSRSLLSAAFFAKRVENFVLTNHFNEDLPVTLTAVPPGSTLTVGQVITGTMNVSQPENAQKTTVKGLEVGYQQALTFLPSALKNLGVEGNYTYIWAGKLPLQAGGPVYPLNGISNTTFNGGIYYESPKIGIHALYNYRSSFLVDPLMYFGDGAWTKSYGQYDVSGSFRFNKSVSLAASVINLTNSPLAQYNRFNINRLYDLSGRRFSVGVRVAL